MWVPAKRQGGAGTAPVISAKLTPAATLLAICGLLPAPAYADRTHGPDSHAIDGTGPTAAVASGSSWCGSRSSGPPAFRAMPWRYHAVYLVPRDRRSRFRSMAATLQADALGASALLERAYGRAIRFDMGTSCGSRYLDFSELRLSATRAELRRAARSAAPDALFQLVRAEMEKAGFLLNDRYLFKGRWIPPTVNYLAWLDGPAPPRSCGQGTSLLDTRRVPWNRNNLGGKLALIYRRGARFCGADTVRHEIGHNLGALQPQAPHTSDGVHCTDALEDTMCSGGAPAVARGARHSVYFDYRNDDYWDPPNGRPLRWWTVNLSWFICPDAGCNR